MLTFPLKGIVLLISLESFLIGYQESIIHKNRESSQLKGILFDILSLIITILTILYMEKLKTEGRRKFLLHNTLILAGCFFFSSVFVFIDKTLLLILEIFLTVVQSVSKTNMLTTILSIISIEKIELGFFFAFQFIVFQVSVSFGSISYHFYNNEDSVLYFYYMIILLFSTTAYFVYRNLSDDHDEVDNYTMKLWVDIIKIRFFRMNFTSFAITLGVASYVYIILLQAFLVLPIGYDILIIMLMFSTYPICLYLVYKYLRPVQYKAFTVFGLVFQSMSMMFLVLVYSDNGKSTGLLALFSPILSQVGLVFVTISSLPDMLESATRGMPNIEFGIVSDRVCSIVFAAYYIGTIFIQLSAYILRNLMSFTLGMIISSLCIMIYAAVYEYFGRGVRDYKKGNYMKENILLERELEEPEDLSNWLNN